MHKLPLLLFATGLALQATNSMAQDNNAKRESNDSITIYSSATPGGVPSWLYLPSQSGHNRGQVPGYAMVRHVRQYDIARGQSQLRVLDVASGIDPTTVAFRSMNVPDTRVLDQSFEFDLVSQDKLMQRYIGQAIEVDQVLCDRMITLRGELLSTQGGLMLKMDNGSVQTINQYQNVRFPELPEGLITRPTLVWNLDAPRAGQQEVQISYQTSGMTWWTDYNLILDKSGEQCKMDLSAWVTLVNQSGVGFAQAKLKLIAGEVNRVKSGQVAYAEMDAVQATGNRLQKTRGFEEKSFNEYHLYTLGRAIDLPQNATKQVEMFPSVIGANCKQVMRLSNSRGYYGGFSHSRDDIGDPEMDVQVYIEFENSEENGMGMPLPQGRVRVSQLDNADGNLEFVGEDAIDHTPRKDTVRLHTGTAFDVKGTRKQTSFSYNETRREIIESWEINVRNRKHEKVSVLLAESLFRWSNWEITKSSQDFEKIDSNRIEFAIDMPADSEKTISYTVRYFSQ